MDFLNDTAHRARITRVPRNSGPKFDIPPTYDTEAVARAKKAFPNFRETDDGLLVGELLTLSRNSYRVFAELPTYPIHMMYGVTVLARDVVNAAGFIEDSGLSLGGEFVEEGYLIPSPDWKEEDDKLVLDLALTVAWLHAFELLIATNQWTYPAVFDRFLKSHPTRIPGTMTYYCQP